VRDHAVGQWVSRVRGAPGTVTRRSGALGTETEEACQAKCTRAHPSSGIQYAIPGKAGTAGTAELLHTALVRDSTPLDTSRRIGIPEAMVRSCNGDTKAGGKEGREGAGNGWGAGTRQRPGGVRCGAAGGDGGGW
jgi:hypothetical protein